MFSDGLCYNTSMKHLTATYEEDIYSSRILDFYFNGMRIGALDIETTGLNPADNKLILGGLYRFQEKTMHQFFAENRSEEAAALAGFLQELSGLDMVITYNGTRFDLPFLEKRLRLHTAGEKAPLLQAAGESLPYHLDLYLVLKGHSPLRKFVPNLKQKTVENYMGLWQSRQDEISGAESVTLYHTYEKTREPELEKKILLHNSDDVLQLTRLLRVISKCDFHKAMFHLGFPAGPLTVETICVDQHCLTIRGRQREHPFDYVGFTFDEYPLESRFESKTASFLMKLPLIRDRGLVIADLEAAQLDCRDFEKYPTYSSGFLVLETERQKNYMEINHFIKAFIKLFLERKDDSVWM